MTLGSLVGRARRSYAPAGETAAALLGLLVLVTLGCGPTVPPGVRAASAPPPRQTAASADAPPIGEPVLVPQRLPWESNITSLDPSGRLLLIAGPERLHVVDVETGVTRGTLDGCASSHFSGDGRSVIALCGGRSARLWDL